MAKCPICNSRKGKRQCLIAGRPVCSLCCGTTRNPDYCSECGFYQEPKRKYIDVPSYTTSQMDNNMEIQSYAHTIEGALCMYDIEINKNLKDSDAIKMIELLIDKYHFGDQDFNTDNQIIANGVSYIDDAIKNDLTDQSNEVIVKILAVIWFVSNRRTKIRREYLDFIHQYVGLRLGPGIRLME